ncbi:hypothetical protein HU200_048996 [Digitaria exilis]|uniref:EGF-like domain-containing protein n=1 Tax=Digitaria exilis TaxID=1010633 RepID=A0A835AV34_9POAL|nr:hypothetical protein HU200_048996 [Digitaria exilis]
MCRCRVRRGGRRCVVKVKRERSRRWTVVKAKPKGSGRRTQTVKGDTSRLGAEGPDDTGRSHGRLAWYTDEQEYMVKMASVKSRRMAMASARKSSKASWHMAEAGHASTPRRRMEGFRWFGHKTTQAEGFPVWASKLGTSPVRTRGIIAKLASWRSEVVKTPGPRLARALGTRARAAQARLSLSAQVAQDLCHVGSSVAETLDRVRELGARHLAPTFQTSKLLPPISFFLSSLSFLSSAPSGRSHAPPPAPLLRPPAPYVGADPHDVGEGKKKWKDRAQKNYPDVSSKDAPSECECGKPARVTQSMHPDTAARAYYKCGDHRKVDERILLFRPSSSKNYESFQRWLPPPPNPPPMTNEEKKEAIARRLETPPLCHCGDPTQIHRTHLPQTCGRQLLWRPTWKAPEFLSLGAKDRGAQPRYVGANSFGAQITNLA